MQSKSKELKKLKNLWYKKLKEEGFNDIEKSETTLNEWHSLRLTRKNNGGYYSDNRASFESTEEYYRQAGWFLNDHKFDTEQEKTIWEKHSSGISIRNIAIDLKKSGVKTCSTYVNRDIKRLVVIMINLYKAKNE